MYLFLCPSLPISVSLFFSSSIALYLSTYLCVSLSLFLSLSLTLSLSLSPSLPLSLSSSLCISIHPSIRPSIHPSNPSIWKEASRRDFFKKAEVLTAPKRWNSARLLGFLTLAASKTKQFRETSFKNGKLCVGPTASYQCVLWLFSSSIYLKYCACIIVGRQQAK